MDITNKTPKEIQQGIFDEIANGTNPEQLRQELSGKGVPTEAYYFTSAGEHERQMAPAPDDASSAVSPWRIIISLLIAIFFIVRIIMRLNK